MPREKRKKRSRSNTLSAEHIAARQKYYKRLMHQCHKDLHKVGKLIKNFECQKLVRKIKSGENHDNRLKALKQYELEPVIQECFRRLGVKQLDPTAEKDGTEQDEGGSHQAESPAVPLKADEGKGASEEKDYSKWIFDRIMKHAKIAGALESWDESVTEYRRYCLQQQEKAQGEYVPKVKKNAKRKATALSALSSCVDEAAGSSLFLTLGGGSDNDNDDANEEQTAGADSTNVSHYGPAGFIVKKNRQGQRGRRAKAAAIAAKKRGVPQQKSLNWRQPKSASQRNDDQQRETLDRRAASDKKEVPPENLHPSWQAQKEKKEGIVAFQGKKIKF